MPPAPPKRSRAKAPPAAPEAVQRLPQLPPPEQPAAQVARTQLPPAQPHFLPPQVPLPPPVGAAAAAAATTVGSGTFIGCLPGLTFVQGEGATRRDVTLDCWEAKGSRPYQEDRHAVAVDAGIVVAGVFDGHGGATASTALQALPAAVLAAVAARPPGADVAALLRECFAAADAAFLEEDSATGAVRGPARPGPGSTAVLALLLGGECWLAWVGDARAALAEDATGRILAETRDQRPNVPEERQRLERMGGYVVDRGVLGMRANGVLACTRAFGNRGLRGTGIDADPEVLHCALPAGHCTLVLGSDGVFDELPTSDALQTCRRDRHPARLLTERAAAAAAASRRGAVDNATAVVLKLDRAGSSVGGGAAPLPPPRPLPPRGGDGGGGSGTGSGKTEPVAAGAAGAVGAAIGDAGASKRQRTSSDSVAGQQRSR